MSDSTRCPKCELVSYHPEDIKQKYCDNCHMFYRDMVEHTPPPWQPIMFKPSYITKELKKHKKERENFEL